MFGKFCLRILVGIVVFCVFGGQDAMGMLVMAVVCTAGVGLLVVIPAAYLIGLLCTIWFIPFGRRSEENGKTAPRIAKSSRNTALADYIKDAELKGQSWSSIRDDLLKMGWDDKTISDAGGRSGATQEHDYL